MSEGPIPCRSDGCDADAYVRYTWPGRDESFACALHAIHIAWIAAHMSLHVQLIPLTVDDYLRAGRESEGG